MKKSLKSALSIVLCMMMVFGTLVLGMTAFAEGENTHNCIKDGHEYENFVANDPYSTSEDYKNFTHTATCKYCGDEATFYCRMQIGWSHIDGCKHYIACSDCDRKYKLGNCLDVDENFKDSNGKYTTDGLCDVCGAELDHRYQKVASQAADCVNPCYDTYRCLNCNDNYTKLVSPAIGHNWGNVNAQTNPVITFDEENFMWAKATFNCTRGCGEKLEYIVWADSGNPDNIVEVVDKKAATCDKDGYVKVQAKFHISDVAAEGWNEFVGDDGAFNFVSPVYTVEIESLGDHNYGDYVQTKAPTCTEPGTMTATCSKCNSTLEVEVAALGHDYVTVEGTAPTCTADGYGTTTCSRCDYNSTGVIPATGHKFVTTRAATCTGEGMEECSECHTTKIIPEKGHTDLNHDGYCEECGILFDAEAVISNLVLSVNNPMTKNVNYGDILVLTAKISTPDKTVPTGYKVVWTANYPSAVILTPSSDGLTCEAKVIGFGTDEDGNKDDNIFVTATLLKGDNTEARNLNGVIHDTVSFKAKIGIYEKIVNFFKTILFFLNRRVY